MKISSLRTGLMVWMSLWMSIGIGPEPMLAQQHAGVPIQSVMMGDGSVGLSGDKLFEAAIAQMRQGELPKALAAFRQVLAQQRGAGDHLGEAAVLTQIGKLMVWQGKYDQAIEQLQNAAQLWNELERPAQQAEALTWLGNSYRLQSKAEQAEARIQKAIVLSQSARNPLREAEALWFLGAIFAQQNWSKAAETIDQALSLVRAEPKTTEQQELEGRILSWVGLAAAQQGEAEKALADLQKAWAIQKEVGDRLAERVTLGFLGGVYRGQGQLEASLEVYQEALVIAQVMQVPVVIGRMQNQVGIAHYRLEQYPAALSLFEQAAETYEASEEHEALAQVWSNIGDFHYQQNQLEAMEIAYEKAASIYKSVSKIDILINHLANQIARELRTSNVKAEGEAVVQEQEKLTKLLNSSDFLVKLSRDINSPYHHVIALFQLAAVHSQKSVFEMVNNRFEESIKTALRGQEINQETISLIQEVGYFPGKQDEINKILNTLSRSLVTTYTAISTAYSSLDKPQEYVNFSREARLKAEEIGNQELIDYSKSIEASANQQLGNWYEDKFDYQRAIKSHENIFSLASQEEDIYLVTLIRLGQLNEKVGNYNEAERYYQRTSQISIQLIEQNIGDHTPEDSGDFWSQSQVSLASVYASRGEYHRAIELLKPLTSKKKNLGKNTYYLLLNNLSTYYIEVGEIQEAKALQDEVIQYYQSEYQQYSEDFNSGEWNFFCENYPSNSLCGRIRKGGSPFLRNLLMNNVSNQLSIKRYFLAIGFSGRGVLQEEQGEYQAALESYEAALRLAEEEEDQALKASILNDQASIYKNQAQYQLAYNAIQESLSIVEAQQDISEQLRYSRELANIYAEQGQFQKALEIHHNNLQTARTIGLRPEEAAVLYRIGYTHSLQGNYAEALDSYEQALALQKDMGDQRDIAVNLDSIGLLYRTLGQVDKAIDLHKQSLEMSQQLNNKQFIVASLQFLGSAYHAAEQPDEALRYFQQALDLNQKIGNRFRETFILEAMSKLFLEQQQPNQAIATLEKSLALSQQMEIRPTQARVLGLLGAAYAQQQQPEQALDALQRSLAIAQDVENRPTEALSLSRLGDLYAEQSPEMAIALYKQSVNTYEIIRGGLTRLDPDTQQSYTNTIADTYRALADLLLTQGRLGEAEQVLELLKIQEIEDFAPTTRSLAQDSDLILNETEQELIQKHNSLVALGQKLIGCQSSNNDCNQLKADRRQLTKALNRFLDDLAAKIAERCSTTGEKQCLEPNDQFTTAAKRLVNAQDNTLVISPLVLQDKVWILVASEGGILSRYESSVDRRTLGQTVLQLRQALEIPSSDLKQLQATSRQLYDLLVEPVLQDNPNAENLVFALDRVTRYIPMSILFDGQHYLTERYAISTVLSPQTTEIAFNTLSQIEESPVLALGLSEATNEFPALPNVEPEVDAIVRQSGIYPGYKFLNQDFTLDILDQHLEEHKVLHLATHAKFVPNQKFGSFLLLGNGKRLPIEDIRTLDFSNIELVVLSACETALGNPEQDGIEIPGLSSFFLDKGADAVMASLWEVDDQSTAVFMQQFYERLSSASITKAQAIQKIQRDFLNGNITPADAERLLSRGNGIFPGNAVATQRRSYDFSHPYYWAPFILIGNGL